MPGCDGYFKIRRPTKFLHGIPNHYAYRSKLEAKWRRKGFNVMFA